MSFPTSLTSAAKMATLRRGLTRLFGAAKDVDEYTLPDLQDQLNQKRLDILLPVLAELTRDRIVDQVFRVVSPKLGGIEDFTSFDAVPDRIFDWHQGHEIDVEPRLVRVFFRKHKETEELTVPAKSSEEG
jgi:hypothetical protein